MDSILYNIIRTTIYDFLNEQFNKQQKEGIILNDKFWKWFGNSKVVDSNGNPEIYYHGTNAVFKNFIIDPNLQKNGWTEGKGIYFSKVIPRAYGSNILNCFLKIEKPIYGLNYVFSKDELLKLGFYDKPIIKKEYNESYDGTYITYQYHPLIPQSMDISMDVENITIDDYIKKYKPKWFTTTINYKQLINMFGFLYPKFDIIEEIKNKLGYDGVIFKSDDNSNTICVVFYENHVKSIYNDGSWDISDNNIFS